MGRFFFLPRFSRADCIPLAMAGVWAGQGHLFWGLGAVFVGLFLTSLGEHIWLARAALAKANEGVGR